MEETKYEVLINLKIPWLTKAFCYLFIICLLILVLFGLYMLPSKYSSDEMKAAYFVLTTSEFQQMMFFVGLVGAPTFFILYKFWRFRENGFLILSPGKIEVASLKKSTYYSIDEITHIACNDALEADGFPKGKLTVDFKDKNGTNVSLTLRDYGQSEQLMHSLLNYENIKFEVTNFLTNPETMNI